MPVVKHDAGATDLNESDGPIIVGRLAEQLLQMTVCTGPPAMLAILNVFLTGMLQALNDDPRLRAMASDALADVAEASRLLDGANATLAKFF